GLEVCRRLNEEQILVTLDHLGENVTSEEEARLSANAYLAPLREIHQRGLRGSLSLKLTQIGLDLSEDLCRENIERIVSEAASFGGFVEIDMESSEYVDRTLRIVTAMHQRFGCVRGVVQAYLRRSADDIATLNRLGVPVRLCKGAYKESASVAFARKREVNENYALLMRKLLTEGNYPGLATHDETLIKEVLRFTKEQGIGPDRFEFQMLYGIRRDLQQWLVSQGYRLRLYVPYGDAWYPYFMRRLAERPANVFFLARNLLRQ
ncbi:MAG: proline dehydrogenase family protein, partial [Bryobacteraceae bacterium]